MVPLGFWEALHGGFRKLREACRIRFHLSWYLPDFMVPSCDQKIKKYKNAINYLRFGKPHRPKSDENR